MFVFIQNQYPESFAFLFPKTLKLFALQICKFVNCKLKFVNFLKES